jgi:hypothetical protein
MLRRDHLRDEEVLEFIENGFRDDVIRFHVMDCAPCRSLLADTLVLIRSLKRQGNAEAPASGREATPVALGRSDSKSIRGFAPMRLSEPIRTGHAHAESRQLRRFYSAAHEWEDADRNFLDVAQRLMACDVCLSQFLALSHQLAPDSETMKKVLNVAAALPSVKRFDVFAGMIDRLKVSAEKLVSSAERLASLRFSKSLEVSSRIESSYDLQFSETMDSVGIAFDMAVPAEDFQLEFDPQLKGDHWNILLSISGRLANEDPTAVSFELRDSREQTLLTGMFDAMGVAVAPADMPVAEVKVAAKDSAQVFPVLFPNERELRLARQMEVAIARLNEAMDREHRLRRELEGAIDRRGDAQEHLRHLLEELDRLRLS